MTISMLALSVATPSSRVAAAGSVACTPAGTTYGTDTMSVVIPSATTYHIWVRVQVPSVSSSSPILLNMDGATGNNCYNVSGSSITAANTWTWVEATAGVSPAPTFSQATHSLVITGLQSGASIDNIEFLNDATCTPTGTGDNCTTTVTNTPPTVSVTTPTNGSTVTGPTTLTATATGNGGATITNVQFQVDNVNVGTADATGPSYTTSWNPTGLSGTHTISAIATDSNQLTTKSTISVTVNIPPVCGTGTLAAPTGLGVNGTPTYTTIGLKWTAPTPTPGCTISGYNVYRDGSTTPLNGGTLITGTTTSDTGLTASDTHTYTVQAKDSGNNLSAKTTAVSINTADDNTAPNVPTISSHSSTAGSITLSWAASTDLPSPGGVGGVGYNIYRCAGANCTVSTTSIPVNGGTPWNGTTYTDNTVSPSTSYSYFVTAIDSNSNESAPSLLIMISTSAPTCSGNPTQPGKPTAGTITDHSASFSWAASSASAGCTLSGYHIYQVNGSTYTLLTGASVSGTTATISSLNPNTIYNFAVEAFDNSGHVSDKTQANAQITGLTTLRDTTLPSAPTGSVSATATNSTHVALSWSNNATDDIGVAGYKVYRNDKGSTALTSVLSTACSTVCTYSDGTASASTTYTYQVSAVDAAGNESTAKISSAAVTTPASTGTPPGAPATVRTTGPVATQSAQLLWSAPTSGGAATGYNVYINGVLDTYNNGSVKDTFTATGGTLNCLAPNTTYGSITVKAFNSAGEGPATTVSITTSSGGLAGDFDCNSVVNGFDLNALATDWLRTNMQPFQGDATGDTTVNGFDLNGLATNWNKSL
jgi:fibronectin type 3 domain-containing protein